MLLSRILGGVGRFCIGLGLLTLLFVAYQLWGTGILTAQAQNGLENDFEELIEQFEDVDPAAVELIAELEQAAEEPADDGADPEQPADPADPADEVDDDGIDAALQAELDAQAAAELERLSNLIWQPNGEPVAQLTIPDIGVDWTVVAGVGTDELRNGPGHYPGTPMPGMAGNAGIAGHRTTWGAPFNRIDELEPGDEITVRTIQGTFTYRVIAQESGKGHFIVSPDRVDVLDQDFEESPNRLTLTACHPKFSARQRIIVVAELVGEPALLVPRPEYLANQRIELASEDVDGEVTPDEELPGDPDLEDEPDTEEPTPSDAEEPTPQPESDPGGSNDSDEASTDDTESEEAAPPTDGGGAEPQAIAFQGTEEADTFGQGLNGDRGAILPAITWGIVVAAIIGTTGFVGRRWRRWPSYLIAATPFVVVLFVCFVHIDQALPSY